MSDERKGRRMPSNKVFDLIDLHERLLRGEIAPSRKRQILRQLLVKYRQEIQHQSEIDKKYVEEKVEEMYEMLDYATDQHGFTPEIYRPKAKKFITQIISDVREVKPKIDERYVEDKAGRFYDIAKKEAFTFEEVVVFLRQIISDAQRVKK